MHSPLKMYFHHFLILLSFRLLTHFSTCHAFFGYKNEGTQVLCVEKERDALLQFKRGFSVDKCGLLDSWGGSLDCCRWRGIRCNNSTGNVISLNLRGIQTDASGEAVSHCLEGKLSDSLVELTHLKSLNLSCIDFKGQSIPKFIGSFTNLEYLDLSYALFSGVIPNEIGNLSKLSYLDLSCQYVDCYKNNVKSLSWLSHLKLNRHINLSGVDLSLTSNWMSVINNLPFLEVLRMDLCNLHTNQFPSTLSYINSSNTLQTIILSGNEFDGTSIFQWLQNLSRIQTALSSLDLRDNQFSVEIPSFIWEINSLSYLNLDYNNFRGLIPNEIGNMQNLSILSLNGNRLSGRIPSEIWTIESLSYLSVAGNNLEGDITNTFSNLKRLTHLDLSDNNLQLSSRQTLKLLSKLCSLQTLMLDDNKLTYDFADVITSLSPCTHKTLVYLSLSNTKVWGSVPDNISNFSLLEGLLVDNNHLNGTISEGIGRFSRLEELDLSSNNLSGVVSHNHFSNLTNLRFLKLSDNQALVINLRANWTPPFQLLLLGLKSCKVGPSFPKWLLTQRKLIDLDLSNAGITDSIPKDFWGSVIDTLLSLNMSNNMIQGVLPDLSFTFPQYPPMIDMSSNNLSGALPSFLRNNVEEFYLNNNRLSQGLFRFLCPKTEIRIMFIDLSNNLFFETLPDCWEKFPSLTVLKLQNNNITGNLPPSITTMYNLHALHLRNNSLSGELPRSWANTSLIVVDFAHNSLNGSIPPSFGLNLVNLRVMSLNNNRLSKGIPHSLCQLTALQILDLSSNHISGLLPKCLCNLTMMSNNTNFPDPISFDISYFQLEELEWFMWNRKEQSFDVVLGLLQGIDVSNNNLQGQIPDEISSLAGLRFLNLSQNNLSGHIPSRIGQLTSLNFLDLSNNHLSGEIPTSLALINSLGILDLSKNKLTGKIPLGTLLQGFNASSYMGNPGLCGAPLPECSGDQANSVTQNGDNIALQKGHKNDDILLGLVVSVVLGLITGFWGVCGTLVLKRSWRIAFFRFYDDKKDKIYVILVVKIIRPCRRLLH